MKSKKKILFWATVTLFFGIAVFLTLNRHSRSGFFNHHSEIWADRAGYYVYLPAAINFNFNPSNFPDSVDYKTGQGFILDIENNKIITRYTYGVALMQLPFYLSAELTNLILGEQSNGFTPYHHKFIDLASVFYLVFGCIFLYKFLNYYLKKRVSFIVLLTLFLGTNLYYYSIDETGMSHVYSYFLFCIYLYFIKTTVFLSKTSISGRIFFGFLCGLIILIRPTNVVFLSALFFLDIKGIDQSLLRFRNILKVKYIGLIIPCLFLVLLPQMIFWKHTYGSYISYSYEDVGFNWLEPELIKSWFSPNNGLFIYTPMYLLILFAIVFMIKKKITNGLYILTIFLLISYLSSAWSVWNFGCSFGGRNYLEYLTLMSLPLGTLINYATPLKLYKAIPFFLLLGFLIVFNLKMSYSWDGCFYGSHDWDWEEYYKMLKHPT